MRRDETVYAIPSWINGRAVLEAARQFHEIRNPLTGVVVRRAPLCGQASLAEALRSARAGLSSWADMGESGRGQRLSSLGDALQGVAEHVAALIAEDSGVDVPRSKGELERLVEGLRRPPRGQSRRVMVLSGAGRDLVTFAESAIEALAGGAALVVFPSLQCPSAWLALAELSAQCGFPPGVLNILYASEQDAAVWASDDCS